MISRMKRLGMMRVLTTAFLEIEHEEGRLLETRWVEAAEWGHERLQILPRFYTSVMTDREMQDEHRS
jgi:hypothetical protein